MSLDVEVDVDVDVDVSRVASSFAETNLWPSSETPTMKGITLRDTVLKILGIVKYKFSKY